MLAPNNNNNNNNDDDEIIINELPSVLKIYGSGCLSRSPDLSCVKYMAHRLEIRDIIIYSLNWVPEWVLEVYLENCEIRFNNGKLDDISRLSESVIHLTCNRCVIDDMSYSGLMSPSLLRLELVNLGLKKLPLCVSVSAPNLLFLNLSGNNLGERSEWPAKVRGLRLSGNKLLELSHLGSLPAYLEDLDLSENLFSEIPVSELSPYLRKLNMSRNELNWLPDNVSDYPPNLRELNISFNCGLDDLTDVVFPDMLTTLMASGCEISRLPHDLNSYCLTNIDVSDNNIGSLDELPFDSVMNINYVGNPCWSVISSSVGSVIESDIETKCDASVGVSFPNDIELDYIDEYKDAISRSSSLCDMDNLSKPVDICNVIETGDMKNQENKINSVVKYSPSWVNTRDDSIIGAIDYVVSGSLRRVESFLSVVSDILSPDNNNSASESSVFESGLIKDDKVLDEIDYYGIFGSFE